MSSTLVVEALDEFELSSGKRVLFYSLPALEKKLGAEAKISRLPITIRILLESLMRNKDRHGIKQEDIEQLARWNPKHPTDREIPFKVGRVLMQDLTGIPALVDLAALRDAVASLKLDPKIVEPEVPVDLVIDHSIQVDAFRSPEAIVINARKEMARNKERYEFLKWAAHSFHNLKLVPPDTGIVHQVNLEFLASVVMQKDLQDGATLAYFDTLVGTDSHTPMVNGLGVLGWGVGGIEAEAAVLGEPVSFVTPEVIGVHLEGSLVDGITATDAVLTVAQTFREIGVVDKFVEFFGEGCKELTVAERATISNMTPEFGATASLFPVDEETLKYLRLTGRSEAHVEFVKKYLEAQKTFGVPKPGEIDYSRVIEIDLSKIEPSVAGPALPHDRVGLAGLPEHFFKATQVKSGELKSAMLKMDGKDYSLADGDVVIAAITSCTNTSNPSVMMAAGLLAKRAVERGLSVSQRVKTSLAPGSMVVTEYLRSTGLLPYLQKLGFDVVGYGCTTCIAQGTPVLQADGTTRRIELLPSEGGTVLFGPTMDGRLSIGKYSQRLNQGMRDCVSLVLQDGRSLVCTPDHQILCSEGRWVRADKLVPGKDRVVVGIEGPLDNPAYDERGYELQAGSLKLKMDTALDRDRMLAFARLLGHLLSDGSISVLGQGRMNVGQAVDRMVALYDIELLTGKRPAATRYDVRKWSITLPLQLTKAIAALLGTQVGRRIEQAPTLPEFVMKDDCPTAVAREFLGGLFGADGHSAVLHRWGKLDGEATIDPPAYSKITISEHLEPTRKYMHDLIALLKRCGVKTDGAQVYDYPTRRGRTSYAMARSGVPRVEVRLTLPDGLSFVEKVGFRYCVDKMMRASAAAVYWRIFDGIHTQRLWIADRLIEYHQKEPNLAFSKARERVAALMLERSSSEHQLPPVLAPHYALLQGYDRFSRLPRASNRKFQPLHRATCGFPSPAELFKQLGVRQWFASLLSREETEHVRHYCVEKDASTLPTFSLLLVDRHPVGQRRVYDLSVPDLHAFIAGTVAVHNCIGNSGPLPEPVSSAIGEGKLTVAAVLSGNRNFEARIHQEVRANFLMSPPLVVAFAISGNMLKDLTREPLGMGKDGTPVFLKDIWPPQKEIQEYSTRISTDMFRKKYSEVYDQNSEWNKLDAPSGLTYDWNPDSTYIQKPPYFDDYSERSSGAIKPHDILGARPLLLLGDYVTTDHISPAGAISLKSSAGKYLISKGVGEAEFNSYGSRRGNHLVMMRGTFANTRIKNEMVPGTEGPVTKHYPDGEVLPIFDAAMKYSQENTPLVVIAGKGFGTGSSRDWAAKGQKLLGVKAVIADSFERIYRNNLVGMGVLPLQFEQSVNAKSLGLDGSEVFDLIGVSEELKPGGRVKLVVTRKNGEKVETKLRVRLDSAIDVAYYKSGGILDYVLEKAEHRQKSYA